MDRYAFIRAASPALAVPVLLGFAGVARAQGTFQSTTIPTAVQPTQVGVADLNNDGIDDLFVTEQGTLAEIFLGGPPGSFSLFSSIALPTGWAKRTTLGDFNNDGTIDCCILVSGGVDCFLGFGNGAFPATPIQTLGSSNGFEARAGDIDGDGNLDLVPLNGMSVSGAPAPIYRGLGTGAFSEAPGFLGLSSCGLAGGFKTYMSSSFCDPNNDGSLDFCDSIGSFCGLPSNTGSPRLDLYKNLGNGLMQLSSSAAPMPEILFHSGYCAFVMGDVTGDGVADVVLANPGSNGTHILVYAIQSNMQFVGPPSTCDVTVSSIFDGMMTLVDTTLDGRDEFLFTTQSGHDLFVAGAPSTPGFQSCGILETVPVGADPRFVVSHDLDQDGLGDVVVACQLDSTVRVLLRRLTPIAGVVVYGNGTPGCAGKELLLGSPTPTIGSTAVIQALSAPPNSLGLLLSSTAQDLAGSDPFGIGLSLHVGFAPPAVVFGADLTSDGFGAAAYQLSIPNDPNLHGYQLYLQAIWLWPALACALPPFQLSASSGLALTVQ